MKKIFKLLITIILFTIPFVLVNASGSINVSSGSVTIEKGKSTSVTITAKNSAGRIDISSSNTSVATISTSSEFLDNTSLKLTISAKSVGTSTISVKLTDVATYDGEVLTGTKTIKVTVKEPATKPSTTPTTPTTPKVEEVKPIEISKFEVVGYPFNFNVTTSEYSIDVLEGVNSLYIVTESKNCNVTGNNIVDITDKDSVKVTFKSSNDTKEYTLNINRVAAKEESQVEDPIVPDVKDDNEKDNNSKINMILLITTIVFFLSTVILAMSLLSKNKANKNTIVEPPVNNEVVANSEPVINESNNNINNI